MMCKLALRNVKRMAKDYIVYFMTMAVVTALMFSFQYAFVFQRCAESVSDGCHDERDDGTCDRFYRADHGVADQLYGAVCTGKAKP